MALFTNTRNLVMVVGWGEDEDWNGVIFLGPVSDDASVRALAGEDIVPANPEWSVVGEEHDCNCSACGFYKYSSDRPCPETCYTSLDCNTHRYYEVQDAEGKVVATWAVADCEGQENFGTEPREGDVVLWGTCLNTGWQECECSEPCPGTSEQNTVPELVDDPSIPFGDWFLKDRR